MRIFSAQCFFRTTIAFGVRVIGTGFLTALISIQIDFVVNISLNETRYLVVNGYKLSEMETNILSVNQL